MIEQIIIDYLWGRLTVPASGEVPHPAPDRFITVEKTGSRTTNRIETATLAVQSWAESQAGAAALNQAVKAAMADAVTMDCISAVQCETDYNFTDTTTKRHRYQALFEVVYFSD